MPEDNKKPQCRDCKGYFPRNKNEGTCNKGKYKDQATDPEFSCHSFEQRTNGDFICPKCKEPVTNMFDLAEKHLHGTTSEETAHVRIEDFKRHYLSGMGEPNWGKCTCNWPLGLGSDLKCPVHGTGQPQWSGQFGPNMTMTPVGPRPTPPNEFNVPTYIPEDPKIVEIFAQLNNPLSRLFYDMALEIETIPASIEQSRVVCLFRTLGLKVTEMYEEMRKDKITAQNALIALQEKVEKHKQEEQDAYNAKDQEIQRLKDELFIQKQFVETRDGVIEGLKAEVDRLKIELDTANRVMQDIHTACENSCLKVYKIDTEIQRLKDELRIGGGKVKEQQAYIEKLESYKAAHDEISERSSDAHAFAKAVHGRLGENVWHITLDAAIKYKAQSELLAKRYYKLASQAVNVEKVNTPEFMAYWEGTLQEHINFIENLDRIPTQTRIEKGIIAIMKDGNIINFPNGNDDEYKAWCKTKESENFLTLLGAREEFLEHELERAEADQIVRGINENGDPIEDIENFEDRIEEYCKHTDPRKYTKKLQEETKKDKVKP